MNFTGQQTRLVDQFNKNFEKYKDFANEEIMAASPKKNPDINNISTENLNDGPGRNPWKNKDMFQWLLDPAFDPDTGLESILERIILILLPWIFQPSRIWKSISSTFSGGMIKNLPMEDTLKTGNFTKEV
jgi:hypothetical protein